MKSLLSVRSVSIIVLAVFLSSPAVQAQDTRVQFLDVTGSAGLSGFNHFSFPFGGDGLAGAAWFDYNNDGLLDLYLTNGRDITQPGHDGFDNALFENQGGGNFIDVASLRGVTHGAGSSGVIAADIDNDGDQDIFLTGDGGLLGHDGIDGSQTVDSGVALYINNGAPDYDYTHLVNEDIGLVDIDSTMSAAMADIDNDGLLDLFITASGTRPEGCLPPDNCPPDPSVMPHENNLFLNRSAGGVISFVDISSSSSIADVRYGALAAVFSDYNLDGRIDLVVGNGVVFIYEPTPIQLYENRGYDADLATVNYVEVSDAIGLGTQSGWMGIAPGDFDGNRRTDFFVTNIGSGGAKPHALLRWATALGEYSEVADLVGISGPSPSPSDYFGWGCSAQDFDLDGRQDIFLAGNGVHSPSGGGMFPNPGTLLMNDPPLSFVDHSDTLGVDLSSRFSSGVATGDYNNDGLVDIAVATDSLLGDQGIPVLLQNVTQNDNAWVTVRLTGNGTTTNRDAVGARVAVASGEPPDRRIQTREVYAGSSFLSMDSKWLTYGLGQQAPGATVWVAVDWPDGPQTPNDPANWTFYGPFPVNGIVDISQ